MVCSAPHLKYSSKKKKEKKIAPGDPILNQDNRMGVQRAEACSPRWLKSRRSLWCFWPQISMLLHYGWQHWVTEERTLLICLHHQQPGHHLAAVMPQTVHLVELLAPGDIDQSAVILHMMQQSNWLFSLCAFSKISKRILSFKIAWWLLSEFWKEWNWVVRQILPSRHSPSTKKLQYLIQVRQWLHCFLMTQGALHYTHYLCKPQSHTDCGNLNV